MTDTTQDPDSARLAAALAAHREPIEAGDWVDIALDGRQVVVAPDDQAEEVRRRLAGVEAGLAPEPERRRRERRGNQPGDLRDPDRDRRRAGEATTLVLSRSEALRAIEAAAPSRPAREEGAGSSGANPAASA